MVDTSIYANIKPLTMDSPLDTVAKAYQIGAAKRQFTLEDDISGALAASGGDYGKAADALAKAGRGTASLQLAGRADAQKASKTAQDLKLYEEAGNDAISLDAIWRQALQENGGNQQLAMAKMQPAYQAVRQKWAGLGKPMGENFDPQQNAAFIGQASKAVEYLKSLSDKKTDVARLMAERDALPANDPKRKTYEDAIAKATTHQPATTVSVSTERGYGAAFAKNIAEADTTMRDTAIKAPDLAERANNVLSVLSSGKVTTGSGADVRLALGKALNLAGVSDEETIANTEALASELASTTLDSIKSSGLGAGQGFTNTDREFLEKAKAGRISLEASTIRRLAILNHRAAEKSAEKWNKRVREIPEDALKGTGITREPIAVPRLNTAAPAADPRAVTLPNGSVKTFPTPAAATAFRKEAGLEQ